MTSFPDESLISNKDARARVGCTDDVWAENFCTNVKRVGKPIAGQGPIKLKVNFRNLLFNYYES
jgi:hypothetical protein